MSVGKLSKGVKNKIQLNKKRWQMAKKKDMLRTLSLILVIVGAVNWGLVGFLNFDLVATIFGLASTVSRVIYGAVGIAGLILAYKSLAK